MHKSTPSLPHALPVPIMSDIPTLPPDHIGRVEIRPNPAGGRGLYAARPYKDHEIIITDPLHAFALNPDVLATHCSGCTIKLPTSGSHKRCAACQLVRYCTLECQTFHWPLHRLECAAMRRLWTAGEQSGDPVHNGDVYHLFMGRLLLAHARIEELVQQGATLPPILDEIRATLPIARSLSTSGVSRQRAVDGDRVYTYMHKRAATPIERVIVDQWDRRSRTNCFQLDDGDRPTGVSLSAVISLLNHSCEPNSLVLPNKRIVQLGSMGDIAAGEELTISYFDEEDLERPVEYRRQMLRQHYNFECQCRRCVREAG